MFKVVWICGQFNKILNDANIFTTAIEPHGKDKKNWKLHGFVGNLVKFQTTSTSLPQLCMRRIKKVESCLNLWSIYSNFKIFQLFTKAMKPMGKLKKVESFLNLCEI